MHQGKLRADRATSAASTDVTSHIQTRSWACPWAKPEPFLWGTPQLQIWSWMFWLSPPQAPGPACPVATVPNLPTPVQQATSTEMAKGLVLMSHGPRPTHAQAVGCVPQPHGTAACPAADGWVIRWLGNDQVRLKPQSLWLPAL